MAKIKNLEHAKIPYDYSLIPVIMTQKNYLRVDEEDSSTILGKSIKYADKGAYLDINKNPESINPTVVRHIARMGYLCKLNTKMGQKVLEVWKPDLLLHKVLIGSVFEWGMPIEQEMHINIDRIFGHVERGKSKEIKLRYDGLIFDAKISNLDRKTVKSDTYQLRFDSNRELKNLLMQTYSDILPEMEENRRLKKEEGEERPQFKTSNEFYIELLATNSSIIVELILNRTLNISLSLERTKEEVLSKAMLASEAHGLTYEEIINNRNLRILNYKKCKKQKKEITTTVHTSDSILKEDIKQLYHYKCQICTTQIKKKGWYDGLSPREEVAYLSADAHHIVPLNENGLDDPTNIICVCPNCHRRLHTREFEIDRIDGKTCCKNNISSEETLLVVSPYHFLCKE